MTEALLIAFVAVVIVSAWAIWRSAWAPPPPPPPHAHPFRPRAITIIRPDGLHDLCADCGELRPMAARIQSVIFTGR